MKKPQPCCSMKTVIRVAQTTPRGISNTLAFAAREKSYTKECLGLTIIGRKSNAQPAKRNMKFVRAVGIFGSLWKNNPMAGMR